MIYLLHKKLLINLFVIKLYGMLGLYYPTNLSLYKFIPMYRDVFVIGKNNFHLVI